MAETVADIRRRVAERSGVQLVDPRTDVSSRPGVHQSAELTELPETVGQIRERVAARNLSAAQTIEASRRSAMTHTGPSTPGFTLPSGAVQPSGVGFGAEDVENQQATIGDKATRVGLAQDLQAAGRVGLETAGAFGGVGVARQLAKPLVGKVAPKVIRSIEAAVSGAGEGAGALAAETFDPSGDPIGNSVRVGILGALGDKFASGLASRFAGGTSLEAGARDAVDVLGPGNSPSTGRLTTHQLVDAGENFIENSFLSSGAITKRNRRAAEVARDKIRKVAEDMVGGSSRVEIDQLVRDTVDGQLETFKQAGRSLYRRVDELAPGGVDTSGIIAIRNEIVRESQKGGKSAGANAVVDAIDRTLGVPKAKRGIEANQMISSTPTRRLMREGDPGFNAAFNRADFIEVTDAPQVMSFQDAHSIRSDLLGFSRSSTDAFPGKGVAAAQRASGKIDTDMALAAEAIGPEALPAWREANQFWRDGADAWGESVMQALANSRPDDALRLMLTGDSPEQVRRFRKLVLGGVGGEEDTAESITKKAIATIRDSRSSESAKEIARLRLSNAQAAIQGWQKMKGQFVINILNGSDTAAGMTDEAAAGTRILQGSRLIDRWRGMGEDTLAEMFTSSERKNYEKMFRALELSQSDTGLSTGRLGTQFLQMSAIGGVLMLDFSIGATGILVGPVALGKLFDNDDFVRWATIGSKAKPGSALALRAMTRMMTIAVREGARVRGPEGELISDFGETKEARGLRELSAAERASRR